MNCPYCGSRLSKRDRCDRCGEDIAAYKKIYRMANSYYNRGLTKARVRDLSGAVTDLRNCLKLNKRHTDARNLLGLIYQEMGESVSALREWVISKHFQNEDNVADHYIELLQNPSRLDSINQIIKKYNGALLSARSGSDDLAIIQLKKVVSMNPRYVQALQLLGLLYMRGGDYGKARKCLAKAAKVDVNNTTTLAYLEEIRLLSGNGEKNGNAGEDLSETGGVSISDRDVITPIHTYAEEKPNVIAWVNLVLGVIIGAAFILLAIVPGIRKNAVQEKSAEMVALNERLIKVEADLEASENEKSSLEQDVEELRYQLNHIEPEVIETDLTSYEKLIEAVGLYYADEGGREAEAAEALLSVNKADFKNEAEAALYEKISGILFPQQSGRIFQEGFELYSDGKYEESLDFFEKALQMNPDNVDAMYFTGRCYHRLEETDTAKDWYNKIVTDYPDTARAAEARDRLAELP